MLNYDSLARAAVGCGAAAVLFTYGCEGSGSPFFEEPLRMRLYDGNAQVYSARTTLPLPLAVLVTDLAGVPAADVVVSWATGEHGGSIEPATSVTGSDGIARASLTLPPRAGVHRTTARIDRAGGDSVVFTSTSLIQGALSMGLAPGESGERTDTIHASLPPYRVLVTDHLGRPVPAVQVTWAAAAGLLSGQEGVAASATDAQGIAEVAHTLGEWATRGGLNRPWGEHSVWAMVPGLMGSPVPLLARTLPGAPASVHAYLPGSPFGVPFSDHTLEALVRDRSLNPVPGIEVDWEVTAGAGALASARTVTGDGSQGTRMGTSTVTYRLGPEEGVETVTAIVRGFPDVPVATVDLTVVSASVTVSSNQFVSPTATIPAGRTVGWHWASESYYGYGTEERHSVTFEDDPSEPVSSPLQAYGTHLRTFHEPGTYEYYCEIHGHLGMRGRVIVHD